MRADKSEAAVIEHLASHAASPELVALAREELRQMRHVPDQAASIQRARLEAAQRRLNEMHLWQTIDAVEYQRHREELTRQQAELPPPEVSNIIAFDKAAASLMPMGKVIARCTYRAPARHRSTHRGARDHSRRRGGGHRGEA